MEGVQQGPVLVGTFFTGSPVELALPKMHGIPQPWGCEVGSARQTCKLRVNADSRLAHARLIIPFSSKFSQAGTIVLPWNQTGASNSLRPQR